MDVTQQIELAKAEESARRDEARRRYWIVLAAVANGDTISAENRATLMADAKRLGHENAVKYHAEAVAKLVAARKALIPLSSRNFTEESTALAADGAEIDRIYLKFLKETHTPRMVPWITRRDELQQAKSKRSSLTGQVEDLLMTLTAEGMPAEII